MPRDGVDECLQRRILDFSARAPAEDQAAFGGRTGERPEYDIGGKEPRLGRAHEGRAHARPARGPTPFARGHTSSAMRGATPASRKRRESGRRSPGLWERGKRTKGVAARSDRRRGLRAAQADGPRAAGRRCARAGAGGSAVRATARRDGRSRRRSRPPGRAASWAEVGDSLSSRRIPGCRRWNSRRMRGKDGRHGEPGEGDPHLPDAALGDGPHVGGHARRAQRGSGSTCSSERAPAGVSSTRRLDRGEERRRRGPPRAGRSAG